MTDFSARICSSCVADLCLPDLPRCKDCQRAWLARHTDEPPREKQP